MPAEDPHHRAAQGVTPRPRRLNHSDLSDLSDLFTPSVVEGSYLSVLSDRSYLSVLSDRSVLSDLSDLFTPSVVEGSDLSDLSVLSYLSYLSDRPSCNGIVNRRPAAV